jgi:hypothetical protein
MTDETSPKPEDELVELTLEEAEMVSGGLNPQPLPPGRAPVFREE